MSGAAIKIENISKLYRLGEVGTGTLSHDLNRWWHKLRGKEDPYLKIGQANNRALKGDSDYAWALQEVSFEIKVGEAIGIIGGNGAGKSTLLKILSRVTTPTSGQIKIKGRIASLLEVGTGFHPELTGRDNIYLNGSILGMRKREIDRKFDEIVAFCGIERYIDTPVKRYSSGMYVRLAFAVAAHLEPEILIVDEVLAVGDIEFQRKCLGKMHDVSTQEGRTVIFVSHNLTAVKTLCASGVLLQNGRVLYAGSVNGAIERYVSSTEKSSGSWDRKPDAAKDKEIWFESVRLLDKSGKIRGEFDFEEEINVRILGMVSRRFENVQFVMRVTNQEGIAVFTTCNTDAAKQFVPIEAGPVNYTIRLTPGLLTPGRYALQINAHIPRVHSYNLIDNDVSFAINEIGSYEKLFNDDRLGVVNVALSWQS